MRVLFDHQAFTLQVYGGISRYFAELIKNAPPDLEIKTQVPYSNNFYLKELQPETKPFFAEKNFKGKLPLFRQINNHKSKKTLKKGDFDLLHPGYYAPYFLKHIGKKPFVLTVHDMTHELYPEAFSKFDKTAQWKQLLMKKANHIIAVSENTKQDILRFSKIEAHKISVIWHGFYNNKKQAQEVKPINMPFLLYVGSRTAYKNFDNFIKAFILLKKEFPTLHLMCTGNAFSEKEKSFFAEKNISESVVQIRASDSELSWLYQNAEAFIFPSFYEGFGIPVLEAFANNCPAILSHTAALKEVGGNACAYFSPENIEDIKATIKSVISDEKLRFVMQKKGAKRLKLFSWQKTAIETAKIYREILNK